MSSWNRAVTAQSNSQPPAARGKAKLVISVFLSVVFAAIPVYLYDLGMAQTGDDRLFVEAIFFWYLGFVFIFSFRYSSRVLLLAALYYAFSKFAVVGGQYRTYIYGAAFIVVGCIQFFRWLTPPV